MKQCTYCGKEYSNEASICAVDCQPLREIVPPPLTSSPPSAGEKQQIIDGEHIKLLSIFHFVVAGLALLGIAFLFLHFLMMSTVFSNPDMWKNQNNSQSFPKDFMKIFIWFYFFMGAILVAAGAFNLLSGLFLWQRKHRTFSIVVGALNCLQIPFGTILGIFTIIVLSRNSVRERYDAKI
jgi:hypothetical protein